MRENPEEQREALSLQLQIVGKLNQFDQRVLLKVQLLNYRALDEASTSPQNLCYLCVLLLGVEALGLHSGRVVAGTPRILIFRNLRYINIDSARQQRVESVQKFN